MRLRTFGLLLGVGLFVAAPAWADRWDSTTTNDNTSAGAFNELYHGIVQNHDFAGNGGSLDEDWYRMGTADRSSYEVRVDSLGGDVWSLYVDLDRFASTDTSTPLGSGAAMGAGYNLSLRWESTSTSSQEDYIRVAATNTTTNNANDGYTIRAFDTQMAIPRYNNAGSQITVLICQNPASYTIGGHVYLWNTTGSQVTSFSFSLAARRTLVQNLASVNSGAAAGTSGAITITNSGLYGDLTCKSVALEPATGFSFDTPGVYKPTI